MISAATFFIFFQAYMVAPLIPKLALLFNVSQQRIGLIVPAYLIPYGIATLFYGLLSDRVGPKRIILSSLLAFTILTGLTVSAGSASELLVWRLLTGLGASGVVPVSLALTGQLFSYEERGRPLGWLFGAMAGGSAFGSSFGVILEPFVGWKLLFIGVAAVSLILLALLWHTYQRITVPERTGSLSLRGVLKGYYALLSKGRGFRTYSYVFCNALFHGGVFAWLGVYFTQRFNLGEVEIGLALLGYGLPGFFLGPLIGRMADRKGRRWLIPIGLALSALVTLAMTFHLPLLAAAVAVTVLSAGYDLTQPLLAGIVTDLGKKQPGQAMGLNVFMLFVGFGVGSYLFGILLPEGFGTALVVFTLFQAGISIASIPLFKSEKRTPVKAGLVKEI